VIFDFDLKSFFDDFTVLHDVKIEIIWSHSKYIFSHKTSLLVLFSASADEHVMRICAGPVTQTNYDIKCFIKL